MEPFDLAGVSARLDEVMPGVRTDLEELVGIPSISAGGFDPAEVRRSAEATLRLLSGMGLDARLLEVEGGHPAVFGSVEGPNGAPTVLLYAHHDVQPTGPLELWSSAPFDPEERDGRLYGRGVADDKAGVMAHVAALRAWEGGPPVSVKVIVEGEEEIGSEHLTDFLSENRELLRADAVILADGSNWRIGWPALTTSLRGLVDCEFEVRVLDHAVHSGMYGGPIPDAVTVLARTLATLHDDAGNVAVAGLTSASADPLDLTEEELRADAGVRPSVRLIGEGGLTERLWTRPAVSVLGIDAPRIDEAANQLVPSAAAKVSLRVAPGEVAQRAMDALMKHLEANVPWGAEVRVTPGSTGEPYLVRAEGPAFDTLRRALGEAWGRAPVEVGTGGTIPFVAAFAEAFPSAALLLTGVEDPMSNAHSENESLHLGEFRKACLAEALFLGYLAERGPMDPT